MILMIVCSTVCSGADQRKHQSSASLAFVGGIHRWLVDSPHKGPVTQKTCPFDDVIMAKHYFVRGCHPRAKQLITIFPDFCQQYLTHFRMETRYGDIVPGQHWFRQWLGGWRHQAITWTNVDLSSVKSSDIHIKEISQEAPQPPINKNSLKIDYLKFYSNVSGNNELTHWGRETHICVGKLAIIGSDDGLSPERRQAIIWTNAGILLIGPLGTNSSEILIEIQTFSLKKIRFKMSSAKCGSFHLGLNVLIAYRIFSRWTRATPVLWTIGGLEFASDDSLVTEHQAPHPWRITGDLVDDTVPSPWQQPCRYSHPVFVLLLFTCFNGIFISVNWQTTSKLW